MAKPIQQTPILTGRDATNFLQEMKAAKLRKSQKTTFTGGKASAFSAVQNASNDHVPGTPVLFRGGTGGD